MKTDPLCEQPTTSSLPLADNHAVSPPGIPIGRAAANAGPQSPAPFDAAPVISGDFDTNRALARRLEILSRPAAALPLILITGTLLFIVNLGRAPIYTKGEAREAITIFDIVHGGGVILPMRAGVEVPSKPLLMHWLAALISVAAGGVSEWTVRMPSALLAIAGALACYFYVRRLFEMRGALLSALMLLTSFQYLQAGTGTRVDMTLTFFLTIAFFEFLMVAEGLRASTVPLYLAIAMAVLTKGPVGIALPALVAIIWIAFNRRWRLLRRMHLFRGALVVGVIGGGWYLAAMVSGGSAFIHKQILAENLYRLTGHSGINEGHAHPFYYEDVALIAGFMPWTPAALITMVQTIWRPRRLDPRLGYLLVWFLTVLIFYNLPQSKRGVYLLALYPALTTMVALYLGDAITHRAIAARTTLVVARIMGAAFVIIGVAGLAGLAIVYGSPATLDRMLAPLKIIVVQLPFALRTLASHYLPIAIALPVMIAAAGLFLMRSCPRADRIVFTVTGVMAALALAINLVIQPALASCLSVKQFAANAIRTADGASLGYFGTVDYAFAFYSGRNLTLLNGREPDPPTYVVCSDDGLRLMPAAMRTRYAIVFASDPTDLDGSGIMYLLHRRDFPTASSSMPSA